MEEINLTKMTDEQVIEYLDADIKSAKTIQDELATQRETYYKAFRAQLYGNEREGWSKSVAPIIWSNHQSNLSALVEIFSDEFFNLKSTDEDRSDKFQKLIRYQMFRKQDGYKKLYDFLYGAGIYHYAIFKNCYHEDFDLVYDTYEQLSSEQMMQLATQVKDTTITKYTEASTGDSFDPMAGRPIPGVKFYEKVKTVTKKFTYKGPAFEVIPQWEWFYSPDCKIGDWGSIDGRLVYHEVKRTLDYIRKKERIGAYRKGTYAQCLELYSSGTSNKPDEIAVRYNADGLSEVNTEAQTDDTLNKQLTIKECYAKVDIDSDGLLEPCIITIIEDKVVAQLEENPYKRPPFRVGGMLPEPHKIHCIAPPSILENDQKVMTNFLRFIQDSAAMSTYRNVVTSDPRMQKMLQSRKPFDVILGDPQKIGEVPVQPPDQFILKAWELMKGEKEETTGNSRYNQGMDGSSLNKTAYGISLISEASARRLRMSAKLLGNGVMTGLIRDFIYINQKWKTKDPITLLGTDIVVNPDDLEGEQDIEIDIGVSPSEKQAMAQQMDLFLQWSSQVGLPMGLTDPIKYTKAVKKKYSLLNLNIDNLLFTEQQVNQKIQEQQQNKPKEDWKEFVAMDKLFPLLAPQEKAQMLDRLGIQPDIKWHQALAQNELTKDQTMKKADLQGKALIETIKQKGTMQQKEQDLKGKIIEYGLKQKEDSRKSANQGNGSAGV